MPSAKIPREIEIEAIPWAASALKTRDLPLTVFKGLILELDLVATTAGAPALTREEMAKAVTKLSLVLNGQDTVISIPFYHLFFQNWYDYSREPEYSFDLAAAGAGKVMRMQVILSFALTRAMVAENTILDARQSAGVNTAVLEVQWGAAAISATTTVTSGNLRIYSQEYSQVDSNIKTARQELAHVQSTLAATGNQETKLDVGSLNQYKRLWLYAKDNTGALSNAQLDKLGVRSRSFYYMSLPSRPLQNWNGSKYSVPPHTGVYVIDFTAFGNMVERLNAEKLSELILEANSLVANGTLDIVKEKAIFA